MPIRVRAATVLMWLLWIGGTVYGITAWLMAKQLGAGGLVVLGIVYSLVFILLALLIRAVMKGRNWARITYSVLAVLAVAAIALDLFLGTSTGIGSQIIGGSLVMAYSAILVLLFHSTSNPWFRRRNAT